MATVVVLLDMVRPWPFDNNRMIGSRRIETEPAQWRERARTCQKRERGESRESEGMESAKY